MWTKQKVENGQKKKWGVGSGKMAHWVKASPEFDSWIHLVMEQNWPL